MHRAPLAIAAIAAVFGTAAAVHYTQLGLALAHYDARAHLVVARRVFDSLTPGWQQVGAVWLPLPHLLNAIPVQSDWLYRTGYSGIAISVASTALAAWAIARLIGGATGSWIGGAVAAALLMINPNVLYLQSTPMTEPLLFGTTFLAVSLIAEWCVSLGGPPSPAASETGFGGTGAPGSTRAAGWACVAAVMTRYEAFPIVAAAIGLAFVVLLRRGFSLGAAFRAVRGLALWPIWALAAFLVNSKVTVGAFFVSGGFYVPENPALGDPWLAWTQIWEGLVRLAGPAVPWLAVVSAAAIVAVSFGLRPRGRSGREASLIVLVALGASAALPLYAYAQGHPERIRYAVPLVAACAALVGAGVALLPRRIQPAAGLVAVALSLWQVPPFDPQAPVVVEAQREAPNLAGRRAVTRYLTAHWDGQPILMSMGSLAHYMHDLSAAGFGIRDFLHEGNGEIWKFAVAHPAPVAEWIAIEERAEGGDALDWQARHDAAFLRGYHRVAEGGGVALYRRGR
ncbi:MAG TPA: hypothetical protein VFK57_07460 [Vicinamibacterales bacterium]|nr:hypothetical protein [Vicinamibacterales bacterium]